MTPDAREALTFLAELDGGLSRAPLPVPGSEECYSGIDVPTRVVEAAGRALKERPKHRSAYWTYDLEAFKATGEHLYYFAPSERRRPPYLKQIHVKAIVDIADDGTLAGVELIDDMPPPPPADKSPPASGLNVPERATSAYCTGCSRPVVFEWTYCPWCGAQGRYGNLAPDFGEGESAGESVGGIAPTTSTVQIRIDKDGRHFIGTEEVQFTRTTTSLSPSGTAPRLPTDTDDADAATVLRGVLECAYAWEGGARLIGNVRAQDISRACREAIDALTAPPPPAELGLETTEEDRAAAMDLYRFSLEHGERNFELQLLLDVNLLVAEVARLNQVEEDAEIKAGDSYERGWQQGNANAVVREATARAEERATIVDYLIRHGFYTASDSVRAKRSTP